MSFIYYIQIMAINIMIRLFLICSFIWSTAAVSNRIITIATDDTQGADYHCGDPTTKCNEIIQEAICSLKDIPVGNKCGLETPSLKNPDFQSIYNDMGGTIIFFSGTFELHKNFIVYSNIILKGQGIDKTILRLKDNAESFYRVSETCDGGRSGFIRATTPSNHIVIRDLTIDGNRYGQTNEEYVCPENGRFRYKYGRYGLFVEGVEDILVDSLKVIRFQGYGFDPHGIGGTYIFTKRMTITNCIAEDNRWDGFTLDKMLNSVVSHNIALNNGRHGFNVVTGTRKLTLSNNVAINNGFSYENYYGKTGSGCGIMVQNNQGYRTRGLTITNNVISGSKKEGLCINNAAFAIVSGNVFYNGTRCISASHQSGNGQGTRASIFANNMCNNDNGINIKNGVINNIFKNNNIKVKYKTYSVGIRAYDTPFYQNIVEENLYYNTKIDVKIVPNVPVVDYKTVHTVISDKKKFVSEINAYADNFVDFGSSLIEISDFSDIVSDDTGLLEDDVYLLMITELSDDDYYPTEIEISDITGKYGFRFDIPFPGTELEDDDITPEWSLGLNRVKYHIQVSDYFEDDGANVDWTNMNTVKIKWNMPDPLNTKDFIDFELIQVGRFAGLA